MRHPRNIRALRTRITFISPEYAEDGAGGRVASYIPYVTVYAAVVIKPRRDSLERGQLIPNNEYTITIRARDDISHAMRVQWNGRILTIVAMLPAVAAERYVQVICMDAEQVQG